MCFLSPLKLSFRSLPSESLTTLGHRNLSLLSSLSPQTISPLSALRLSHRSRPSESLAALGRQTLSLLSALLPRNLSLHSYIRLSRRSPPSEFLGALGPQTLSLTIYLLIYRTEEAPLENCFAPTYPPGSPNLLLRPCPPLLPSARLHQETGGEGKTGQQLWGSAVRLGQEPVQEGPEGGVHQEGTEGSRGARGAREAGEEGMILSTVHASAHAHLSP